MIPYVYSYSVVSGVEKRRVERTTPDAVSVVCGISGEVVRRSDLDGPAARYFTDPLLAIRAFIAKAEAALADASRRKHHADWRGAMADAQKRLEGLSMTDKDKGWQDRYQITSTRGTIWKRSEVAKRAVDKAHGLLLGERSRPVIRAAVELVLDDDEFMRGYTGMVPARVVEDVAFQVFFKLAPKAAKP